MNTQNLLRIVSEVLHNEKLFNFQHSLNQILNFYNENNPDKLNEVKENMYVQMGDSMVNRYVNTDFKVLHKLEIYGYFDAYIKNEIEGILGSQSHEVVQKLTTFINKRNELLQKITKLKQALDEVGIKENELDTEIYQVAFSFPEKYHRLDNLEKVTGHVDQFLKSVSIQLDSDNQKYEIVSVGDGCIEYFIQVGADLADIFLNSLETILMIKGAIDLYGDTLKTVAKYSAKNRKSAGDIAAEELEATKKKYIDAFVKKLKIEGDQKKDKENRARNLFKMMVGYFEEGVSAEVRTPYLEEPREANEDDDKDTVASLKKELALYKKKREIDEINQNLFKFQKEGLMLNLPSPDPEE